MKKLFLSLVVAMLVILPIMADNDKIITREELPEKAQIFLTKHFADVEVLYAKAERDMGVITSYDVVLDGNVKVEFNRSGEWINVDCEHSQVPVEIIPTAIQKYVAEHYPQTKVVKIELTDHKGYDVELDNGFELEFDKRMRVKDIDR